MLLEPSPGSGRLAAGGARRSLGRRVVLGGREVLAAPAGARVAVRGNRGPGASAAACRPDERAVTAWAGLACSSMSGPGCAGVCWLEGDGGHSLVMNFPIRRLRCKKLDARQWASVLLACWFGGASGEAR